MGLFFYKSKYLIRKKSNTPLVSMIEFLRHFPIIQIFINANLAE